MTAAATAAVTAAPYREGPRGRSHSRSAAQFAGRSGPQWAAVTA